MPTLLIWHGYRFRFYALIRRRTTACPYRQGWQVPEGVVEEFVPRRRRYSDQEIARLLKV